jgi:hypothetical protein
MLGQIPQSLADIQVQLAAAPNANALAQRTSDILAARGRNHHDEEDTVYQVVPLANGQNSAHWPQGLNRSMPRELPMVIVDPLLADFGEPHGAASGSPLARRIRLAMHRYDGILGERAFNTKW